MDELRKSGIDIEATPVENKFFGSSVTVAGLLTGRDVMKSFSGAVKRDDILLIPDIVMKEGAEVFLDNVTRHDIEELLGIKTLLMESTPKGLVEAISSVS